MAAPLATTRKLISVVVPCLNEEANIVRTYTAVKHVLDGVPAYRHEIIFVDNGSDDRSAALMRELVARDGTVRAVLLSRNFGPDASGVAGFAHARGDALIILMADLQDPPGLIPEFLKRWEEGYDLVLGQATAADEGWVMRSLRRLFYALVKKISYIDIPAGVTGYGLFSARVNQTLQRLPERNRFFRGLLAWTGFKRLLIPYQRSRRQFGRSSYSLLAYLKYAEKGLFSFTTLPLDIISYLGIFLVGLSLVASIVYVSWVVAFGNPIKGSATLFLGIMFFGGAQIFSISIVGKYIGIIFEETKQRPPYLVREVVERAAASDDGAGPSTDYAPVG